MTDTFTARLPEVPTEGRRLGRHVEHDPRSWLFPAPMAAKPRSVTHTTHGLPLDQGNLGSCVGNAAAGLLSTGPFYTGRVYDEAFAVDLYAAATAADELPGVYPPTDTGSTALGAGRAMRRRGLVASYHHAFGLSAALRALTLRPALVGIGWRTGCDSPNAAGFVRYEGPVRGGHEVLAVGLDVEIGVVWFMNSWGPGWGLDGRFAMSIGDFGRALDDNGDFMVVVPPAKP